MTGDERSTMWGLGGQLTLGIELGGPSESREAAPPPMTKPSAFF
jgi:hypothetical protein